MNKWVLATILTLLFSLLPITVLAEQCRPSAVELSLREFSQQDITVQLNGTVIVYLGHREASIVDIFDKKAGSFQGVSSEIVVRDYPDNRNWFMRKFFKKPDRPSDYFMKIQLTEYKIKEIIDLGKRDPSQLNLTIRQEPNDYKAMLTFLSNLSYNCKK